MPDWNNIEEIRCYADLAEAAATLVDESKSPNIQHDSVITTPESR
ncbi:hypothetical protein [Mycolicibacterium wolinskyi]